MCLLARRVPDTLTPSRCPLDLILGEVVVVMMVMDGTCQYANHVTLAANPLRLGWP
jgi:hypothetical protein